MTLRELFDAEYERLAKYLSRHSDPETGEDLASEAFARLATREVVSGALLWRTATNALTDWQRNRKTRPDSQPLDPRQVPTDRPGDAGSFASPDAAMFRADFDRAFRTLPQPLAEAFTVIHLRGLTTREAATVLGQSQKTVSRRASLARTLLKGSLA